MLIREYAATLGFDLAFQNFDKEMTALSEMYNDNEGGLFIAYVDAKPVGVAGVRRFNTTDAEVKRMYVKTTVRGLGVGKLLLQKCIEAAAKLEYRAIKLDTTSDMKAAMKLYTAHGFVEIDAYRFNPQENARYFELVLTK